MKKNFACLLIVFIQSTCLNSQELFSVTEPASNKPSRSVAIRVDQTVMDELNTLRINYHLIPGIAAGISKKMMLEGNAFFSNRSNRFLGEGGSVYGKYRFLKTDALQQHFRMSVSGRISYNNSDIHQEEIDLYGHNTGYSIGVVATQLLKKVALSTSLSWIHAEDNGHGNKFNYGSNQRKAIDYTFSIGKLMLPKQYENYNQTNFNLMLEFLSQFNTGSGKYYIDVAPSAQLIFSSRSRIDIGYRKEVAATLLRTAPNGFLSGWSTISLMYFNCPFLTEYCPEERAETRDLYT